MARQPRADSDQRRALAFERLERVAQRLRDFVRRRRPLVLVDADAETAHAAAESCDELAVRKRRLRHGRGVARIRARPELGEQREIVRR